MIDLKKNSQFKTSKYDLSIERFLGKGKSGYSYLAKEMNNYYVLKLMHNEKCDYYKFQKSKVELEIEAFNKLVDLKIRVPKFFEANYSEQYLVKEFINGELASNLISRDEISDDIFEQLFKMSNVLISCGINIDYFPNNFVIKNNVLYYIDYEINEYSAMWNLENWGIYYWLNTKGMKTFLESGDATYINSDITNGIPIKEPFTEKANNIIGKYTKAETI